MKDFMTIMASSTNESSSPNRCTLIIRHMPECLTNPDKEDFIKHFGALNVRCMPNKGYMKHCAFATFANEILARKAMTRLHQAVIFGCTLNVAIAKSKFEEFFPTDENKIILPDVEAMKTGPVKKTVKRKTDCELLDTVNENLSYMCPQLGLKQLWNPNIHYLYPTPTPMIITNISHTIAAVPKLYYQVLHLMNKMNLPAPFGSVVSPAPPLREDLSYEDKICQTDMTMLVSSDESELESDEDVTKSSRSESQRRGTKRKKSDNFYTSQQSHKHPKITPPTGGPLMTPTDLTPQPPSHDNTGFIITPAKSNTARFEFSITGTVVTDTAKRVNESSGGVSGGGFGKFEPVLKPPDEVENERVDNETVDDEDVLPSTDDCISLGELRANRLTDEEMKSIPVYKNYSPGEVTSRLYVKNLSKTVQEKDLKFVFGRFVKTKSEDDYVMFDIRLVKHGRMRDQAFISFPDEDCAAEAIRETNGYRLLGKPIAVYYARSAKAKTDI